MDECNICHEKQTNCDCTDFQKKLIEILTKITIIAEPKCDCLQKLRNAIDWAKKDLVEKNFTGPELLDIISRIIGSAIRGDFVA